MKWDKVFTKEFLEEEYVKQRKPIYHIAREQGCAPKTIRVFLKKYEIPLNPIIGRHIDYTEQKFGRVTVLSFWKSGKFGKSHWNCICDCGNRFQVAGASLKRGLTKSCGCLKTELVRSKGYKDISYNFWRRQVQGAAGRGYEFDLTMEQVWELYEKQNRRCALSNLEIKFFPDYNLAHKHTVSIDRINSQKGYTIDNIQLVHKVVNQMKNIFDTEEFVCFCNLIAERNPRNHEDCIYSTTRNTIRKI